MTAPASAISKLESRSIPPGAFRHRDHIQMAWNYLQEYSLGRAIDRYAKALKGFATHHGVPEKYHETITWAYMLIINERMGSQPGQTWEEFIDSNPDLLSWPDGPLQRYYTPGLLESEEARRTFLMPDRLG